MTNEIEIEILITNYSKFNRTDKVVLKGLLRATTLFSNTLPKVFPKTDIRSLARSINKLSKLNIIVLSSCDMFPHVKELSIDMVSLMSCFDKIG